LELNKKPVIGITMGDVNGIGPQIILKALADERVYKSCQIVIFGSESVVQFYKKTFPSIKTNVHVLQKNQEYKLHTKLPTLIECSESAVEVKMGESNDVSGTLSLRFINDALFYLQQGKIDILVTAPINKAYIKTSGTFTGHTEYLAQKANVKDALMVMTSDSLRVALVTQHIPIQDIAKTLSTQLIIDKIKQFNQSLAADFGCRRPKIAVLALNPHGGENGKIGTEEIEKIVPHFDGILAMYHDQGLIPFKYIAGMSGINFTAHLPYVRTSPDHGVALDIVELDTADHSSMYNSIMNALDIYHTRASQKAMHANPLPKINTKDLK
jgi:4-hydroxythreonine-4-phosphate dehydrogenase